MRSLNAASLGLAAMLLAGTAASAKTLVYCSEGSPENFTPALNTTGTSLDAARPVFDQLVEFERAVRISSPALPKNGTSARTVLPSRSICAMA